MNHSYFLVSLDLDRNGQTLWGFEVTRLWQKFEPDHSLRGDSKQLILSDEELSLLLKYDCQGVRVEEFDSAVTNSLWAEYADDDGGPAQLTSNLCLDRNLNGNWQVVEAEV